MLKIILLTLLSSVTLFPQEIQTSDQCFNCHQILEDRLKKPSDLFKIDIHFKRRITCAGCHGGDHKNEDPEKSMSKEAGFIGVPRGHQVSLICSKCHSNKYNELKNSVHGQSAPGKGFVINNCITCHGVHNITSVKSPASKVKGVNLVKTCSGCHSNASFMKKYNPGLPVDQLEKYKTSAHGLKIFKGDPKAANCASCHGSHDIKRVKDPQSKVYFANIPATCNKCHGDAEYMKEYKIPTDQYVKFKSSVHGVGLYEKGDTTAMTCIGCHSSHGNAPPGIESLSKVCGTACHCHPLNSQMFDQSPHKEAFNKKNIHKCGGCHSIHDIIYPTDEMLGIGEKSVCIKCHQKDDKGYNVALKMKTLIDSLSAEVSEASYLINEAEQKDMDVSDSKFDPSDIMNVLVKTRTIVHYCDIDKFIKSIEEGFNITSKAKNAGQKAIDEYYFRRMGLGVSTIFITIIVISLYLKVRKIKKKQSR